MTSTGRLKVDAPRLEVPFPTQISKSICPNLQKVSIVHKNILGGLLGTRFVAYLLLVANLPKCETTIGPYDPSQPTLKYYLDP